MKRILIFITVWLLTTHLQAQVTIGDNTSPADYSILELISGGDKGLRLPQMSSIERDAISFSGHEAQALGLQIFNTTTLCVETWNGAEWISACNCNRIIGSSYPFCLDQSPTIADLITKVGGAVEWYSAPTGGAPLPVGNSLTETIYYAEQTGNCKSSDPRIPVTVTFGNCSAFDGGDTYKIWSPVSVMYTYQYQDLELYKGITTGGDASNFQWYVKKKNAVGDAVAIPGATSATYTIPVHYKTSNDTLVFTCEYWNPIAPHKTASTEIEFIQLDETQFEVIDGVKYYWVELNVPYSASPTNNPYANPSGKIRILTTSLGVETADAADFGDFYQWGRIADGHEKIAWTSKDNTSGTTVSRTVAFDAITNANIVDRDGINYTSNIPALEYGTPFLQVDDAAHIGKFVYKDGDGVWQQNQTVSDQYIWATASFEKTANDPCPPGWHVPTRYEWRALVTNSTAPAPASNPAPVDYNVASAHNDFRYSGVGFTTPFPVGAEGCVGGMVITQGNNRLFLPASGNRPTVGGCPLSNSSYAGSYWSSRQDNGYMANFFNFSATQIWDGAYNAKIQGHHIRCVQAFVPE